MQCVFRGGISRVRAARLAGVRTASRRKAALEEAEKVAEQEVIPTEESVHEVSCFTLKSN